VLQRGAAVAFVGAVLPYSEVAFGALDYAWLVPGVIVAGLGGGLPV